MTDKQINQSIYLYFIITVQLASVHAWSSLMEYVTVHV